ncbi:MAG: hypothetical protein PUF78_06875 [Lachnospiraceae bacterium]|nr:hypothetical protein [Lachnospiraceae bacterium]
MQNRQEVSGSLKCSKKTVTKLVTILSFILLLVIFLIWICTPTVTPLVPKSASGVQLVAKTTQDFRSSTSRIYIKYPDQRKLVETEVVFADDEGYALAKQEDNLHIEWIDDHHVLVSFQGRTYLKPTIKIIKY